MCWESLFHTDTARWFRECVGEPTAVQRAGWPCIASGESTLISAPTGTGKTLCAFLPAIDRLCALSARGELKEKTYILYITPLKALGNDIERNLRRPLNGVFSRMCARNSAAVPVRALVRNGDTTPAERRQMLRHPPHILITTPESLYLLITAQSGRDMLSAVDTLIVDELHALIDSKRGAHLTLSLERLEALCGRPLQRIGLSATVRPLDVAARCLGGYADGRPRSVRVVAPRQQKAAGLAICPPAGGMDAPRKGGVWREIFQMLADMSSGARTTLVFCEGRAVCEKVAHGVNALLGADFARTHHGCVSKEQRLEAERALKDGSLRMLCATSSMELGIDVGEIDLVVQIGAPASVSRAKQRLGRAGHRPDALSVMRFLPLNGEDLMLDAFIARGMEEDQIESARPPRLCMDVLSQHLVSMAAAGTVTVDEALRIARGAHGYTGLTRAQLEGVLGMLSGDFERDMDPPPRARVLYDRVNGRFEGDRYTRMLALSSSGTIPDRGWYAVVLEDGHTRLGELDEEFVFEARVGDRFLLGAFSWQIVEIGRDRVVVKPCPPGGAQSPFWRGDGMGRPYETGALFGGYLRALEDAAYAGRLGEALGRYPLNEDGVESLSRRLMDQLKATGALPTDRLLIAEHFSDDAGQAQLLIHSVFGRPVNLPLGLLLQRALSLSSGRDVRLHVSDDGILLYMLDAERIPGGLIGGLNPENVREEVARLLPGTPLFTMAFRYNALRALMMGVRPRGRVPLWIQRLRGAEALSRAVEKRAHPLMWETMRECLEDYTDLAGLERLLFDIRAGRVRVLELRGGLPSPMALSLRRQLEAAEMYDYDPVPAAARAYAQKPAGAAPPEMQDVRAVNARRPAIDSPNTLHALMMNEGDLTGDEITFPSDWLEKLAERGRVRYVDPGLWICAEQEAQYLRALEDGDADALAEILRRCLRFRGPMDEAALGARYCLSPARVKPVIDKLARAGHIRAFNGEWMDSARYERAQNAYLSRRRRQIETAPAQRYAALLNEWHASVGAPEERLRQGLGLLSGLAMPLDTCETVALCARTLNYRGAMLDQLLSSGEAVWQLLPGEKPLVRFSPPDRLDWNFTPSRADYALSDAEWALVDLLARRGASFAATLSAALAGADLYGALRSLTEKGLVRADSFQPLRALYTVPKDARRRARFKSEYAARGRWELARPPLTPSLDERLDAAFSRWAILSREAARREGIAWDQALARLRVMEYTGQVRRGYFVDGLSGAQFVRAADFERVYAQLGRQDDSFFCLNAADPLSPWGSILKIPEGQAFLCVSGTVLVLCGGSIRLIFERYAQRLRVLDSARLDQALACFARAFSLRQVYPSLNALTLREYPNCACGALEAAGFSREMLVYALRR